MAEDKNEVCPLRLLISNLTGIFFAPFQTTTTTTMVYECAPPINLVVSPTWLEKVVFGDFRIWHILFSGMAIFTGVSKFNSPTVYKVSFTNNFVIFIFSYCFVLSFSMSDTAYKARD